MGRRRFIVRRTTTLCADEVLPDVLALCEAGVKHLRLLRRSVRSEAHQAVEELRVMPPRQLLNANATPA